MTPLDQFKVYVADIQSAAYYGKWVQQNPALAPKWVAFRDAVLAGSRPAAPDMGANYFGRALVDAGLVAIAGTPSPFTVKVSGTPQAGQKLSAVIS